jgi:hypothetical protein
MVQEEPNRAKNLGAARPVRKPYQALPLADGLDGSQMARYEYAIVIKAPASVILTSMKATGIRL